MNIARTKAELEVKIAYAKQHKKSIGFVPTMGALHQGHLALMQQSINDNAITVVSIFVNPTQFNNKEDLKKYPRNLEADALKIAHLNPDIILFAPDEEEMYGNHTEAEHFEYDGLEHEMEGAKRPGHFDGVGTILKKLFEFVKPTRAYFGEKDFQQLQIVKKLVEKNQWPIQIIGMPTQREASGLAMSSRNERLTDSGKEKASFIYQILCEVKQKFQTQDIITLEKMVQNAFAQKPEFTLEYFEIADEKTLKKATHKVDNQTYRAFIVVHLEGVRLIDNIALH